MSPLIALVFAVAILAGGPERPLTPEALVEGDWSVLSPLASLQLPGGYPIEFNRDGSVLTDELGGVVGWTLVDDELRLQGPGGETIHRFRWLAKLGLLDSCVDGTGEADFRILVVPPGEDWNSVGRKLPGMKVRFPDGRTGYSIRCPGEQTADVDAERQDQHPKRDDGQC